MLSGTEIWIQKPIKPTGFADLHIHTNLSDGNFSVKEIIEMSTKKKVRCISITDHDKIDSYYQGKKLAAEHDLELIPGVEISSVHQGRDIHILGYFFDPTNLSLNLELQELTKQRHIRVKAIIKKLNSLGVEISYDKVLSFCKGKVIGRPHIALAMLAEELVGSFGEAFQKYLGEGAAAFVEKNGISPQETVKLIENAGGVAVMAHPFITIADELIPSLVEAGLKGIEVYSPGQKGAIRRKYRSIARRYNLVGTGGSDYHSSQSPVAINGLRMPYAVVEELRNRREKSHAERF